eukprot:11201456-Lingulodinium_polyedra.AAC.1
MDMLTHIPGVANVDADALSRLQAPEPKPFPSSFARPPHFCPTTLSGVLVVSYRTTLAGAHSCSRGAMQSRKIKTNTALTLA